MPAMDKTGPLGQGTLTGRGLGPCGRGFRRGFGRRFLQPLELSKEEEKKILESEKAEIEKRLKELKE